MDDRGAWRLLPATHPDVPVLLVSAVFGAAAYAVQLTDLVHVWTEQLDRRALCMRAFQENTSIDPSYDGEQMAVFLGKLAAALDAAHAEHGQTAVSLGAEESGDLLVLRIEAALPGGLQPLRWPMRLRRQPVGAVAAALVVPLVRAQAARRRERAALVAALRDKDAALVRLADKLEALGAGVDSAFPSLARPSSSSAGGGGGGGGGGGAGGKRKWTRADVEQRVRGLAPFREEEVLGEEAADDGDAESDVRQLVESVFGAGPPLVSSADAQAAMASAVARLDGWWRGLGSGPGLSLAPIQQEAKDDKKTETVAVDADAKDDAFQTTPQRRPVAAASGTPPTSPSPATTAVPTRQKAGLGKIGRLGGIGKAKAAQPEAPKPSLPEDDDETASEAEEEAPGPSPAKTAEAVTTESSTPAAAPVEGSSQKTSPPRRPAKGLGKIGGKAKKAEDSPAPETTKSAPAEPDTTRATVLQAAVAKHAAPVRKKRKF